MGVFIIRRTISGLQAHFLFVVYLYYQGRSMARVVQQVDQLLANTIANLGYEYVGAEYFPQGRSSILRVYIEKKPNGVTIDDCARVSVQLGAVLDVEDVLHGQYQFEVSSPGMERPLFTVAHFQAYLGRKIKVKMHNPIEGQRNFSGVLQQADEETFSLLVNGEVTTLPMPGVEKANLLADFDKGEVKR
jgi:ribosome maturation factor RimP